MIFNFAVYFTLTSKIASSSSSFESSAPSYRPLPFLNHQQQHIPNYQQHISNHRQRNHQQHNRGTNINPTIESKIEASYQPTSYQPIEVPPSVQRPDSESKIADISYQQMEVPPSDSKQKKREKYIVLRNRDIFGRCDLGDRPVLISEAEQRCEYDPMCKAFVEVDGQAYLKSCADPDASAKEGRSLHVHHSYYSSDAADSQDTPNLRKPLPRIDPEDESEKNNPPPPPPRRDTHVPIHINGGHEKIPCDVPCFTKKGGGGIVSTRTIKELDATVTYSMEGEM